MGRMFEDVVHNDLRLIENSFIRISFQDNDLKKLYAAGFLYMTSSLL